MGGIGHKLREQVLLLVSSVSPTAKKALVRGC
jgi:hypothetical protein